MPARATGTYERRFQALARVPLLVIDDFGLKPLREDLHDLVAAGSGARHGAGGSSRVVLCSGFEF